MAETKRSHQKISSMTAALHRMLFLSLFAASAAFFTPRTHHSRSKRQRLCSTTLPDPSLNEIKSESNFWRSVVRRDDVLSEDKSVIPCDPSLDAQGSLPSGAYQILGNQKYELKPTCRLSVAIDSNEKPDLARLHRFIDCGLTTFALNVLNEHVYKRLQADTPNTVLRTCQFITPFSTPSTSVLAQPSNVRDYVLEKLRRMGGDCIDTLQLECMSLS